MMIPWFKVKAGNKTLVVREEPEGCGIRCGFRCFHANNTLYRLLWEFANRKLPEQIKKDIIEEYSITEEEFYKSLREANNLLKNLGLLSEDLEETSFNLLKVKGGE